jgi:hypothetical protein
MTLGILLSTVFGPGGFAAWLAGHNGAPLEAEHILGWYVLLVAIVTGFTVTAVARR